VPPYDYDYDYDYYYYSVTTTTSTGSDHWATMMTMMTTKTQVGGVAGPSEW